MNYKIIIAMVGFAVIFSIGMLFIVGTILKWKPLINPDKRQWLFSTQYIDRNYLGISWVTIHNIIIGLLFILVGISGLIIGLHKLELRTRHE
jgi:hypothetical protein